MAANLTSSRRTNATAPANRDVDAFMNIGFLDGNGNKHNVGGISMRMSQRVHAALIERLQTPEGIQAFIERITVDLHLVSDEEFKLDF